MQRAQNRQARTRRSYSAQYKAEVVASFLTTGKTVAQLAEELNLGEATARQWIRLAAAASLAASRPVEEFAVEDLVVTQADPSPSVAPPAAPWGAWPVSTPADWYDADAVGWIQETGTGVAEAAYRLGVGEATVRRWLQLAAEPLAAGDDEQPAAASPA